MDVKGAQRQVRLDVALVERGFVESWAKARALVLAGEVSLPGWKGRGSPTPGTLIAAEQEIVVRRQPRYVSRGGEKLEHALRRFGVDPAGLVCLDVGASTGGFTDCLLQHGAKRVYAVDVGRAQLHARLRADPRVVSMERVNARVGFELPERVGLIVADVSFISLHLVLPPAFEHLEPGGLAVVLLKPQFEAEPAEVGKGGVVRDLLVQAAVIGRFVKWAGENGVRVLGLTASPIRGEDGNQEFLLKLRPERLA